jgi:hypothetical protein
MVAASTEGGFSEKEGIPVPDSRHVNSDKADHILIKRMVRAKKGKWTRFPPEVINRRKNEMGEWEDGTAEPSE